MQIDANGVSIRYEVDGAEGAPWITFVTGIANDVTMWNSQVSALAGDWRILRLDWRGHGGTEAVEGPYTLDLLAGDIVAVWDALDIRYSHLVGIGLGGVVAATLALAEPDRVESVVPTACRATLAPDYAAIWPPLIQTVLAGGIEAVAEPTVQRWFTDEFRAANPDVLEDVRTMIRGTSLAGYLGCIGALLTLDYAADLPKLKIPALFVSGGSDLVGGPSELMQGMADAVPDGRHEIVPAAGHIVNMGNPDGYNRTLGRFLRGL